MSRYFILDGDNESGLVLSSLSGVGLCTRLLGVRVRVGVCGGCARGEANPVG